MRISLLITIGLFCCHILQGQIDYRILNRGIARFRHYDRSGGCRDCYRAGILGFVPSLELWNKYCGPDYSPGAVSTGQ